MENQDQWAAGLCSMGAFCLSWACVSTPMLHFNRSQSPPSTDTRTARSKWKIGLMKWEAEVSRFTKKLDWSAGDWKKDSQLFISNRFRVKWCRGQRGCLSWQKKTQEFFRWSHWIGGLIFWDSREESPQGEVRKVQRTRRTCDPSNKQGELLFCWWWFRLEHFCQINTPPWSRIDDQINVSGEIYPQQIL